MLRTQISGSLDGEGVESVILFGDSISVFRKKLDFLSKRPLLLLSLAHVIVASFSRASQFRTIIIERPKNKLVKLPLETCRTLPLFCLSVLLFSLINFTLSSLIQYVNWVPFLDFFLFLGDFSRGHLFQWVAKTYVCYVGQLPQIFKNIHGKKRGKAKAVTKVVFRTE